MLITWACLLQWVKVNPELALYTKALAFEASLKLNDFHQVTCVAILFVTADEITTFIITYPTGSSQRTHDWTIASIISA